MCIEQMLWGFNKEAQLLLFGFVELDIIGMGVFECIKMEVNNRK